MIFSMIYPAEPAQRFSPDSFALQVGGAVGVNADGIELSGTLIEAKVSGDGRRVLLTFDVPEMPEWSR